MQGIQRAHRNRSRKGMQRPGKYRGDKLKQGNPSDQQAGSLAVRFGKAAPVQSDPDLILHQAAGYQDLAPERSGRAAIFRQEIRECNGRIEIDHRSRRSSSNSSRISLSRATGAGGLGCSEAVNAGGVNQPPRTASARNPSPKGEFPVTPITLGGQISAITRSRSITRIVSPEAASRMYSPSRLFSTLIPTDFMHCKLAADSHHVNRHCERKNRIPICFLRTAGLMTGPAFRGRQPRDLQARTPPLSAAARGGIIKPLFAPGAETRGGEHGGCIGAALFLCPRIAETTDGAGAPFAVDGEQALLALEDGELFHGVSVGAPGRQAVGELVFNTAMTGYQEILTDPSYSSQLVALTCPHIGNVGINARDAESAAIQAAALVVRDASLIRSSWRAHQDLRAWLREENCPAIAGVDTRRLTNHLRSRGALRACLAAAGPDAAIDAGSAVARARAFPGLAGMDLAQKVSTDRPYIWQGGGLWPDDAQNDDAQTPRFQVTVYDFGVKRNLLRALHDEGCALTVVPARTPAREVLDQGPDGVFLSNGPGDPEPCGYAIEAARQLLQAGMPLLGVCLGHQILALACGARTVKMKFGHHGANHPVRGAARGRVMITSQNHGFAVDPDSLPEDLLVTARSLFDGSVQGIRHRRRPALGVQGHPEASPGPHDGAPVFRQFIQLMTETRRAQTH